MYTYGYAKVIIVRIPPTQAYNESVQRCKEQEWTLKRKQQYQQNNGKNGFMQEIAMIERRGTAVEETRTAMNEIEQKNAHSQL